MHPKPSTESSLPYLSVLYCILSLASLPLFWSERAARRTGKPLHFVKTASGRSAGDLSEAVCPLGARTAHRPAAAAFRFSSSLTVTFQPFSAAPSS